jgi:hypothetical protein
MRNKFIFIISLFVISLITVQCDNNRKEYINKYYSDPYPIQQLNKFIPLPVGAVQPEGWLKKELQTWAEGITGHLQEYRGDAFWNTWDNRRYRNEHPNVIGDKWWYFEHQAYWADGLIQLAYILDDQKLKKLLTNLWTRFWPVRIMMAISGDGLIILIVIMEIYIRKA